jgi:hypothetical protein
MKRFLLSAAALVGTLVLAFGQNNAPSVADETAAVQARKSDLAAEALGIVADGPSARRAIIEFIGEVAK